MNRIALLAVVVAATACSGKSGSTAPLPPGGSRATGPTIGQTMADAPTHAVPGTIEVQAPCNQNGYLKLDVPAGTAFTLDVRISGGTAMIDVTDANGKSAGSTEITMDAPKTIPATGQDGATFVAVSETGACTGNTVILVTK